MTPSPVRLLDMTAVFTWPQLRGCGKTCGNACVGRGSTVRFAGLRPHGLVPAPAVPGPDGAPQCAPGSLRLLVLLLEFSSSLLPAPSPPYQIHK